MKRILVCLLVAALGSAGAVWAGESVHGQSHHWGYVGEAGPSHWGDLDHSFTACKEGHSQSPIDITKTKDIDLPAIEFNYQESPLKIIDNGHAIQVDYAPGSSITVDGKTYKLVQFHFHTLSENAVNGKLFPMEAHLVHADADGKLAVVGVLFDEGETNPFIEKIWKNMPTRPGETVSVKGAKVNVMDMLPKSKDYYSWTGSLTTPPCTEGVTWMLLQEPVTVSAAQAKKLEKVLGVKNNRPVQPLYDRTVNK